MSDAFDKVWHTGLINKLESMGVYGDLLKLIKHFLNDRIQRVLIIGQTFDWLPVKAGVLQGSILGPLVFLIYINDLPDSLASSVKLFPDDTLLFSTVYVNNASRVALTGALGKIAEWTFKCKMQFNLDLNKQAK